MAESCRVLRDVFVTVINIQAGNQVNLSNQTIVNEVSGFSIHTSKANWL